MLTMKQPQRSRFVWHGVDEINLLERNGVFGSGAATIHQISPQNWGRVVATLRPAPSLAEVVPPLWLGKMAFPNDEIGRSQ